ncbi:replication factor C subunit 3-like [Salvia splendens]|uniref:replication factor C subunit 3-like n=1 Tax=Salvia splendens TaxID=180675 RepID=UPI001C2671C8|nr:replication factor C subunit 3-like [Salvia splendens]
MEKHSESSPGRESQSASSISSGSKSRFAVKVREWSSSWFSQKKLKRGNSSSSFSSNKTSQDGCASKTTESVAAAAKVKAKKKKKESERENASLLGMINEDTTMASQKPLRERDFEPLPMLPLSPLNEPLLESLPHTLPQITQPKVLSFPSPPPTPLSESQSAPTSPMVLQSPAPAHQTPSTRGVRYDNQETNTNEYEIEYIWAEKYRPLHLQDFLCNRKAALELQAVVRNLHEKGEDFGHFICEGNPGVGKRTMICALLREAFGPDKVQAKEERKEFHFKGEAVESIHVNLMVSPQHTEVNLSELKGYAKHVILELINEKNQNSDKVLHSNLENSRAIILYEVDKLSTDSLSYMKWMLEKFKGCNKVFFCCSDASKLESIKPLCRFIQLLEPTNEEILKVLASIAHQEGIKLPQQLADKITQNSRNNLRQAIRSFEATWNFNCCKASLKGAQLIRTGWEDTLAKIARNAVKEQSPKQLYNIRQELQILLEHNVAPGFLLQALKDELKIILPQHLLPQFDKLYDSKKNHVTRKYLASTHQLVESGKQPCDPRKNVHEFMNIEEFIARFMSWYKAWV